MLHTFRLGERKPQNVCDGFILESLEIQNTIVFKLVLSNTHVNKKDYFTIKFVTGHVNCI